MKKISRGAVLKLMRHRPFRIQFAASSISMMGSTLTPVALTFGVMSVTDSMAELGYVLTAYSVTQVVFMLIGGVWADRLPRQHLMMIADGIRVFTQLAFGAMLLSGHAPLWGMICLQAVCGAATAFFLPASVGLVATTAPPGQLQEANAMISLTRNLIGTLGPLVAGALVLTAGAGWALIVDGITFLGSLIMLSRLNLPGKAKSQFDTGFMREMADGWREVIKRSWVWSTILTCTVFNLIFAGFQMLAPAMLSSSSTGALAWGAIVAGLGLGQVVGHSMAVWFRPQRLLLWGRYVMLLAAPILFMLGAGANPALLAVGGVLAGVAISLPDTLWDTALQQQIPDESLARVSSFDFLGSMMFRPVGLGLATLIASRGDMAAILTISGVILVAVTLLSLADRAVRSLVRLPEPAESPSGQPQTASA